MSVKCPSCKKWMMEGESCRTCAKNAEEEAEKKARADAAAKAEAMKAEVAERKAKLAAGEQIDKAEKTELVSDAPSYTWKFDFQQPPLPDLNAVDWSAAVGIQRSAAGSEGVFFVSFPQGAVCVKPSSTIAADVFCDSIARKCGVCTPDLRVIGTDTEEGVAMYEKLCQLDNKRPAGEQTVSQSLQKKFLLLMQYIKGINLEELPYSDAQVIFASGGRFVGGSSLVKVCKELGGLVAFDVLVNNSDRLPCVWDNDGNAGNIMFTPATSSSDLISLDSHRVVGIDNCITAISPAKFQENLDKYCARVEKAVTEAVSFESGITEKQCKEFVSFENTEGKCPKWCGTIKDMVERLTGLSNNGHGVDIGNAGCAALVSGFVSAVRQCSGNKSSQEEKKSEDGFLSELSQLKVDIVAKYGEAVVGLDRIDTDYLAQVWKVFQKCSHKA